MRSALHEALALAVRLDALLADSVPNVEGADAFRMRLARAHVLGVINQLAAIVGPQSASLPKPSS